MAILVLTDLPAAIQSEELAPAMLAGSNAKAARVAPCLLAPTSAPNWAAATAKALGNYVTLPGGEFLVVKTAGTTGGSAPAAPALGSTVTDGTVTWQRSAPTADQLSEAKLVLIGAVKRWVEAGSGALQAQTVGPFGMTVDTRQRSTGFNLWPSEIKQLQDICATGTNSSSSAFSIAVGCSTTHLPWCSLNFGATYCSCGADIAGFPIFEASCEDLL